MSTPNIKSFSLSYLKNRDFFITYPEHLNYFTVKALKYLLGNGFQITEVRTTGLIPFRRKCSNDDGVNIKELELQKTRVEGNTALKLLKRIINFALSVFRKGDTIKIFAIKKLTTDNN